MTFPRRPIVAVAAGAVLIALTGCGSSSGGGNSVLGSITVEGTDPAKAPTITLKTKPLKVSATESKVLTAGKGAAVTAADVTSINAMIVNGTSGKVANDTWTGGGAAPLDLTSPDLFPAVKTELPGKKVGSRLLIAAPMKDVFGAEGNPSAGFAATDSVVLLIDIVSSATPLKEAKGAAVAPKEGLPTVKVEVGKPATITIPPGVPAPTSLIVQPLITGTGPVVADGQNVRVSYTGALWKDGSTFDSSALRKPGYFEFTVGKAAVIKAWDVALKGATVGSRLLLVVPPDMGYGTAGSPPKIAADDTLVFVVDVLAAY